jgi:DNA-binding PadR family transcriptional regulator
MVLGILATEGPRHGHQIRRAAELTNVGQWGGVSVGALYRELRTMDDEGLVTALRTEKVGRRPARTVYAITDEGRLELAVLRGQATSSVHWGTDPLGVALTFAGTGQDREELATWLQARRGALAGAARVVEREMQRLLARGYIGPVQGSVMRRAVIMMDAEVRWHDEFAKLLAELPPGEADGDAAGTDSADQAEGHRHDDH